MTWLRKRDHAEDDDHASNNTPDRSFAEVLAQLATQRGILENVKDDAGESEGPAEPAAPFVDEAVTRISRSNLILKIQKYGLERPGVGSDDEEAEANA